MKKFIIIAKLNDENIVYMYQEEEVEAKSWKEAYATLRERGFTPFVDVHQPSVNS